jgi:hypothetical protein
MWAEALLSVEAQNNCFAELMDHIAGGRETGELQVPYRDSFGWLASFN